MYENFMTTLQIEIMQVLQLIVTVAVVIGLTMMRRLWNELDKLHNRISEGNKELHKRINQEMNEMVSYREFKEMREDVKFLRLTLEAQGDKPPLRNRISQPGEKP